MKIQLCANYIFSSNLINSWNDFFETARPALKTLLYREKSLTLNANTDAYVSDSFFESISDIEYGGAILLSSEMSKATLLIERSVFQNCQANVDGGAVYYFQDGNCVFSKVCSYNCVAYGYGMFCVCQIYNSPENKNEVHDSSICHKPNKKGNSSALFMNDGIITEIGNNISYISTVYIGALQAASNYHSYIRFTSITNNTSIEAGIILLSDIFAYHNLGDRESIFAFCNVIHNKQLSYENDYWVQRFGIINIDGPSIIGHCSFYNNVGQNLIFQQKGESTFQDCYLHHDGNVEYGNVVIDQPTDYFVNRIELLCTAKCEIKAHYTIPDKFVRTVQLTCNRKKSVQVSSLKNILHIIVTTGSS